MSVANNGPNRGKGAASIDVRGETGKDYAVKLDPDIRGVDKGRRESENLPNRDRRG